MSSAIFGIFSTSSAESQYDVGNPCMKQELRFLAGLIVGSYEILSSGKQHWTTESSWGQCRDQQNEEQCLSQWNSGLVKVEILILHGPGHR